VTTTGDLLRDSPLSEIDPLGDVALVCNVCGEKVAQWSIREIPWPQEMRCNLAYHLQGHPQPWRLDGDGDWRKRSQP
jgi:hypothetical protein